ncbi:MAG: Wzz/FepE/Etk N-terminal domain-containing protein [Schleiferiaceae bacterium]
MANLTDVVAGRATLGDWMLNLLKLSGILRRFWKGILLFAVLGGLLGLLYGLANPRKYQAEMIIAVEDDDSNGWQNLLQQFGIDVGRSNPGGIFKGDALIRLFSTRNLVERTLLQEVEFGDGTRSSLANRLWPQTKMAKAEVFNGFSFPADRKAFTPLHDSAMMLLYRYTAEEVINADKPERKLSLIMLRATHTDKYFTHAYVTTAIDQTASYYVELLTSKAKANLQVLRREADSVQMLMQKNLLSSANSSDLNINPNRASLRVDQNRALVELQVSVTLYGEIIKNLKLAEIGMRKQTPIIQIVDYPQFPLNQVGMPAWQWSVIGAIVAAAVFFVVASLIPQRD